MTTEKSITSRVWLWAAGLVILSLLELPLMGLIASWVGPVLQPWPFPLPPTHHPVATDMLSNLGIPFGGFVYAAIWALYFCVTPAILRRSSLSSAWRPSWLLMLAVLGHVVVRSWGPWLAVVLAQAGLEPPSAAIAGIHHLRPDLLSAVELPLAAALAGAWVRWREAGSGSPPSTVGQEEPAQAGRS